MTFLSNSLFKIQYLNLSLKNMARFKKYKWGFLSGDLNVLIVCSTGFSRDFLEFYTFYQKHRFLYIVELICRIFCLTSTINNVNKRDFLKMINLYKLRIKIM